MGVKIYPSIDGEMQATAQAVTSPEPTCVQVKDGTWYTFPSGTKVSFPAMQAQGVEYETIMRGLVSEACSACDISYEVAVKIFGSSYSASVAARSETMKRTMIDHGEIKRIVSAFARFCLVDGMRIGAVPVPPGVRDMSENSIEMRRLCRTSWGVPVSGAVNPLMEAKAREINERNNWASKHDNAAALGHRLDSVLQRNKEAIDDAISLTLSEFRDILTAERRSKLKEMLIESATMSEGTE
jgi:capsid protein